MKKYWGVAFICLWFTTSSYADASYMLEDHFLEAIRDHSRNAEENEKDAPAKKLFREALKEKGVDTRFLWKRAMRKLKAVRAFQSLSKKRMADVVAAIKYEAEKSALKPIPEPPIFVAPIADAAKAADKDLAHSMDPIAIHLTKMEIIDQQDTYTYDDVYLYLVVTHGDLTWGRITSTYKGLGSGSAFLFDLKDRAIFGPKGTAEAIKKHVIVDIGIIESDGDDIEAIKALSEIIIDVAGDALKLAAPGIIGQYADRLRKEVTNLMKLLGHLSKDDRLFVDTFTFTPQEIAEEMGNHSYYEIKRNYRSSLFFNGYYYRLFLRVLRPD
jgi:hypothetical protein